MATTDPPLDAATTSVSARQGIDPGTRQGLLAMLHMELVRAYADAEARGVPKEKLDAYFAERAAVLRDQIDKVAHHSDLIAENATNTGDAA